MMAGVAKHRTVGTAGFLTKLNVMKLRIYSFIVIRAFCLLSLPPVCQGQILDPSTDSGSSPWNGIIAKGGPVKLALASDDAPEVFRAVKAAENVIENLTGALVMVKDQREKVSTLRNSYEAKLETSTAQIASRYSSLVKDLKNREESCQEVESRINSEIGELRSALDSARARPEVKALLDTDAVNKRVDATLEKLRKSNAALDEIIKGR